MSKLRNTIFRLKTNISAENKTHLIVFLLIFFFAVGIRLCFLFAPMRFDEAWSFNFYISRPLSYGLSRYIDPNNHPLYTLLAHLSCAVFGMQPWAIRLPALISGILLIPASYVTTRLLYDKDTALITAGFVGTSSALIQYSTNGRGYIILCLVFQLIVALAALQMEQKKGRWPVIALLSLLGFYTIPIMLYPFAIVMVWLFFSYRCRTGTYEVGKIVLVTGVLTVFLYLPFLFKTGLASLTANDYVLPSPWPVFMTGMLDSLSVTWGQWNRDIPSAVSVILAIGFVVSLVRHTRLSRYRFPIVLACITGIVPILFIQRAVPFPRTWLFLMPLFFGVSSAGICYVIRSLMPRGNRLKGFIFPLLAIVVVMGQGISVIHSESPELSNETTGGFEEAEKVALFLKGYVRAGDTVLSALLPVEAPLRYYFTLHHIKCPIHACWITDESPRCESLDFSRRVIVVIKSGHKFTNMLPSQRRLNGVFTEKQNDVRALLDRHGLGLEDSTPPKLLFRHGSASVYEVEGPFSRRKSYDLFRRG